MPSQADSRSPVWVRPVCRTAGEAAAALAAALAAAQVEPHTALLLTAGGVYELQGVLDLCLQ